jgi:NmrA-like family
LVSNIIVSARVASAAGIQAGVMTTSTTTRGRVVVTGGSGYIAGYCIAELLSNGWRVRTTIRNLARADETRATIGKIAANAGAVEFIATDLNSDVGWANAVTGADYVVMGTRPHSSTTATGTPRTITTVCGEIENIRRRESRDELEPPRPGGLRRGNKVRIRFGHFGGLIGILVRRKRERARVRLGLLGSEIEIDLPSRALEPLV